MRTITAIVLCLSAITGHAACYPIGGSVTSIPVLDVQNCDTAQLDGFPLTNPFEVYLPPSPGQPVCFDIIGTGVAKFQGVSRLTAVPILVTGGTGEPTSTPLAFQTPDGAYVVDPVRAGVGLSGFTSRAALTGRVLRLGKRPLNGTLYTSDTGFITAGGQVGQILIIVGGEGDFETASGTVAVSGQEVGGQAVYTGSVCVAD